MQVAVAGMEDVGDARARSASQISPMRLSTSGSCAGRDRAVHAEIVGDAARWRRRRPCGPSRSRRSRPPIATTFMALRVERLGDRDDAAQHVVDLGVRALDLDDQHRLDVERVAGMGEILADLDRRAVHELDAPPG